MNRKLHQSLLLLLAGLLLPLHTEAQSTSRSKGTRNAPLSSARTDSNSDWNQFRGPDRDNICREQGLSDSWPDGGPELLQTITGLGESYGSVSFAGSLMYVMGNVDGGEHLIAMDRTSGQVVWKTRNGDEYRENMGNGPRSTPTVVDGRVYSLGGNGDLSCVNAQTGDVVWRGNILKEFGGGNITWGISESVLVDDGKVICSPGGSDATVVALDAKTGRVVWKSKVPEQPAASYASPVVMTVGRIRQYVIFTSKGICGVRASDGEPLWGQNASSNGTANCATPLVFENFVFSSSDYGTGAELVELKVTGRTIQPRQVYFTKDMKNHHGGMILKDGFIYGSNADMLSCVEMKTGKPVWRERGMKGSVVYADGKIVFRNEQGPVVLLAADSTAYKQLGRFDQPDRSNRPAWAHPVIADGKLYLRDQEKMLIYNLK